MGRNSRRTGRRTQNSFESFRRLFPRGCGAVEKNLERRSVRRALDRRLGVTPISVARLRIISSRRSPSYSPSRFCPTVRPGDAIYTERYTIPFGAEPTRNRRWRMDIFIPPPLAETRATFGIPPASKGFLACRQIPRFDRDRVAISCADHMPARIPSARQFRGKNPQDGLCQRSAPNAFGAHLCIDES